MIFNNFEVFGIVETPQVDFFNAPAMLKITDIARKGMSAAGQRTAFLCCGCEVRFVINSGKAIVNIELLSEDENIPSEVVGTIMFGSFYKENFIFKPGMNRIEIEKQDTQRIEKVTEWQGYPFSPRVIRILLPAANFGVPTIEGDISLPKSEMLPKRTYLAYGSSITNAGCCYIPSETYVFKLASQLKAEQRNIGFPGTAFLEKSVADFIAKDCEFDYLSLELGANMVWDMEKNCWAEPELFEQRVDYFISTIFEAHPKAWKVVTDMFLCGADYAKDPEIFAFRDIVRKKMMDMLKNDCRAAYFNGNSLLTRFDGLSADMLHPGSLGMTDIANNMYNAFVDLQKFEYQLPENF